MDRVAVLKKLLDEAGISEQENYLYEEREQGPEGALVETLTLFRGIQEDMLKRDDPEWLDKFAKNISGRQKAKSPFHEAMCAVAASNVDRAALIEVIRYFQSHIAYFFLSIHDGVRPASEADESLVFGLVHENRSGYEADDYDRRIDRMRLLPDELHALYENFLADSGDDFSSGH